MKPEEFTTQREQEVEDITDTTVDHPVGLGIGATSGALAGAAAGLAGGPIGIAIGAVVGGALGGAVGHSTAQALSPTDEEEERYWSENHAGQDYAEDEFSFEDYRPAYRLGSAGPARYATSFEEAETSLQADWDRSKGASRLDWSQARPAARAGWSRMSDEASGEVP